jgi:Cu+-exporting ATPase
MLPSPATPRLQTSFLVPNLHCPTCVSHVTALIHELDPTAVIRNISIVNHIVTIVHGNHTPISSIQSALTSNGYEIFDIIRDTPAYHEPSRPAIDCSRLRKAVQRWTPRRPSQVDETTRLLQVDERTRSLHDANCQMCAAYSGREHLEVIAPADDIPLLVATLSIEGMTCSSCVGNVTKTLQGILGVERADVSLIGHSASVHFRSNDSKTLSTQLVDEVEDAGYGAQLMGVQPKDTQFDTPRDANQTTTAPRTVSIRVSGMHCPICPQRVTEEVQSLGVSVIEPPNLDSPT